MAQITLDGLAHAYGPKPASDVDYALKRIDHTWSDGGAYALLGPSGCGKTTLLNIISGLLVPSKGRILFGDDDVTRRTPEQRNIAQVFQFPVIYDTMTVAENLAFPLLNRGVDRHEIDQRVTEMLATLDLADQRNRKARGLTADEKQKISLGRGLVRYDVNAILFDEPLTVIDPHMKWQLRTKLKELHEQFGHTMIYVTHDQTEALTFADKVVVMYAGAVVQIGTPQELFDSPAHTFVGYFIGSPGMNILPARISGNTARIGEHCVVLPQSFDLPAAGAGEPTAARASAGGQGGGQGSGQSSSLGSGAVEIGIRPEFVSLVDAETGASTGAGTGAAIGATADMSSRPASLDSAGPSLPITVRAVEDIGRYRIVRGLLDNLALDVVIDEHQSIPERAAVRFDPERISVYHHSHRVAGR